MIKTFLLGAVLALGANTAAQAATVTKYFTLTYFGDVTAKGSFSYDDSIVGNLTGYASLSDFSLKIIGPTSQRNFTLADTLAWNNYRHFGYNTVTNSFFGGNTTGFQGCCAAYVMSAYAADLSSGFGINNSQIEAYRANVPGGSLNLNYNNLTITNNAVPEPATWIMPVAAFGLTGAAMRRRHLVAAA